MSRGLNIGRPALPEAGNVFPGIDSGRACFYDVYLMRWQPRWRAGQSSVRVCCFRREQTSILVFCLVQMPDQSLSGIFDVQRTGWITKAAVCMWSLAPPGRNHMWTIREEGGVGKLLGHPRKLQGHSWLADLA